MFTSQERERYNLLRERELDGSIVEEETAELAQLMQRVCNAEAAYLVPSNHRKAAEAAEIESAVERLDAENSRLREYLRERQAFLVRARALVDQLRSEDRNLRERFRDTLALAGEHLGVRGH